MSSFSDARTVIAPKGFTLGPCTGGLSGRALVFAGLDPNGQPVALKTLDPTAVDPLSIARFLSECRLHRLADGAPHVLPLVPCVEHEWLIMRWAHGGSFDMVLDQWRSTRAVSGHRVNDIVMGLLTACEALAARGIVHRDIKPSNVLLDGDTIWLSDFGIAADLDANGVWQSLPAPWVETEVGSAGWAAPELHLHPQNISPANDIYSVGKVWSVLADLAVDDSPAARSLRALLLASDPRDRPTAGVALQRLRCADLAAFT